MINIPKLCSEIKRYDFNLRLSINLTSEFDDNPIEYILGCAKELNADQLTLRALYQDDGFSEQANWVRNNRAKSTYIEEMKADIQRLGRPLNKLPFGAVKYSIDGITCVLDDDCMSTEVTEDLKYMILRPDCKLYSHWDDKGSLVF
jgi:hypothetical protein